MGPLPCSLRSSRWQRKRPDKKRNILVIWGDDIGYWHISAYNRGI
jgi:hypothetical protein